MNSTYLSCRRCLYHFRGHHHVYRDHLSDLARARARVPVPVRAHVRAHDLRGCESGRDHDDHSHDRGDHPYVESNLHDEDEVMGICSDEEGFDHDGGHDQNQIAKMPKVVCEPTEKQLGMAAYIRKTR